MIWGLPYPARAALPAYAATFRLAWQGMAWPLYG